MTLKESMNECKNSWFLRIVVNNKFMLFDRNKEKIGEHIHLDYIKGFENTPVDYTTKDYAHKGYITYTIYVTSPMLELQALKKENIWYDNNNFTLWGGKYVNEM